MTPAISSTLRGISSMATRVLLAELAEAYAASGGGRLELESVGGVDAARRVRSDEAWDLVFLAADAVDGLLADGYLLPGSRVDLARSGVAVAVAAGAALPDIRTEDALRAAVLAAPSVSYSTGPSGVAFAKLLARWGITEALQGRLVQAPAGVPVGTLVARGEVALGFQQRSELLHLPGIQIVGPLPDAVQITTVFSAGIGVACTDVPAAQALLAYMTSREADAAKLRQGMEPA
ncbi:MAG: substrate-binding domain-containing protein [Rhodoferax sp.]|nr:substrate-binding domain-containing protein [Rhodoferax sp.]